MVKIRQGSANAHKTIYLQYHINYTGYSYEPPILKGEL